MGFGGDSGPTASNQTPDRDPDHVVESPTLPQQALLYHGLCTCGIVCKAVVESALDGDPTRVGTYTARFSGQVFPGETLVIRIWEEPDRHVIETRTKERGTRVLGNAGVALA